MVIGTDCIGIPGSFKSNYHAITTTMTLSEKYFSVCNEIQQLITLYLHLMLCKYFVKFA